MSDMTNSNVNQIQIMNAAKWLAAQRDVDPDLDAMQKRFALTATEAVAAIKEAKAMRDDDHR